MRFEQRFNAQRVDNGQWHYQLGEELNGGFGGTNGGVLAAVCVNVARNLAPGRRPIGVDARFIRGFRPGSASVIATVLYSGRTLCTVSVDIFNDDKLTTRGTVSLVNPEALENIDAGDVQPAAGELKNYEEGRIWREPAAQKIPLIETFKPRQLGKSAGSTTTAVDTIWDEPGALEEASCIAADISVGPPVAAALAGRSLAMPNPDISLRFVGAEGAPAWLVSTCHLESVNAGIAATRMQVRDGNILVAIGVSTTTCLKAS